MTTTLYKIKDGCVGLISPTSNSYRSIQRLGGKGGGILHAHLEPLQVEFRRSIKKKQIPEDVRILTLFLDLRNSTFKCSKLARKVNQHFPTSITQILTAAVWGSWFNLHAILEHFKVEYSGFEKSAWFLRVSGLWHFFQILEIPLLSASNWYAKWINNSV
jgi:hypothetical protein